MKNMKDYKNENLQKLIILEGFMQNGLQNRNQRNYFLHLFETNTIFDIEMSIKSLKNIVLF